MGLWPEDMGQAPSPGHAGSLGKALWLNFSGIICDKRLAWPLPPYLRRCEGSDALGCPRKPNSGVRAPERLSHVGMQDAAPGAHVTRGQ